MPRFLSKLIDRLSEREVVDPEVRQAFQQAMDLEGCIRLLLPEAGLHEQGIRVWRAGLISVGAESFTIDMPSDGRERWQCEVGGTFEVAVLTRQGRQCGLTQCLERTAIQTGGSKAMPGWTLAYPPTLTVNERRRAHRVPVGFDLAPRAAIIDGRSSGPIEAQVMDLSIGGLQLRCAPWPDRLHAGQTVDLELHLPEPVGSMLVPVRLAGIRPGDQESQWRIGVAFTTPVDGMAELVRSIEIRRARRRRSESTRQQTNAG